MAHMMLDRTEEVRIKPLSLAEEAAEVRRTHPALFRYLRNRDRQLQRALRMSPSQADIELSAVSHPSMRLTRAVTGLGAGIGELADAAPTIRRN